MQQGDPEGGPQVCEQTLLQAAGQLILDGHTAQLPTIRAHGMCAICVLQAQEPFRPLDGRAPDLVFLCAPGRIRTCDTRFRRAVLYPLSYEGGGLEETLEKIQRVDLRQGNQARWSDAMQALRSSIATRQEPCPRPTWEQGSGCIR